MLAVRTEADEENKDDGTAPTRRKSMTNKENKEKMMAPTRRQSMTTSSEFFWLRASVILCLIFFQIHIYKFKIK
jgi:hypothetical protein